MAYRLEKKLETCNENIRDSVSQVIAYLNDGDGHLFNTEALKHMCENIQTIDVPSAVSHLKNTNNIIMELEKLFKYEQNRRMILTNSNQSKSVVK